MMMFYRRRALPKHRYSIIEVEYSGGGHRPRLRDQRSNVVSLGCPPAPVYKGARRGAAGQGERRAGSRTPPLPSFSFSLPFSYSNKERRSPTPVGVGLPPWRALLLGRRPPPCSFLSGGRGAPHGHTIDQRSFSRVRCPPPPYYTSIIS